MSSTGGGVFLATGGGVLLATCPLGGDFGSGGGGSLGRGPVCCGEERAVGLGAGWTSVWLTGCVETGDSSGSTSPEAKIKHLIKLCPIFVFENALSG